jgi:hypothetical protein
MSLRPIEELHEKIRSVQRRRKAILSLRHISLGLVGLIVLFLVIAFMEMSFQFTPLGRITLLFVLLVDAGVLAWWHIRAVGQLRSDERRLAHYVEDHIPDLEQRLMTSMEFDEKGDITSSALLEKLWEDASTHVKELNIPRVTTSRPAWYAASAATFMICLLLFVVWSSPRFSRASHQVIWPWAKPEEKMTPPVTLTVEPGDIRIRRGDDVTIIATVKNAFPEQVHLYIQKDRVNWEPLPMQQEGKREGPYTCYVSSIKDDLSYYVDIGLDRSRQYRISVFDIPRIEQIDVEYLYPKYTGMEDKTEEKGGDIVAPEGTRIVLHVTFNKPIQRASLKFDRGEAIELDPDGTVSTGSFMVTADATYMIEAVDHEQLKNEDPTGYFVRSVPDSPPELALTRPGRDLQVMPLEEVSIAATAKDDYGLTRFALHYSVAKGEDQEVPFLEKAIQQLNVTIDGKTTIYFEDLNVEPGDFVTYYLTAADNNGIKGPSEVISDIYFLEVVPTEEEFRRASQQLGRDGLGGQGGRGQRSTALVQNQKDIIAATWKLLNRRKRMRAEKFEEEVKVVAESQRKVMQRTQMSLMRLGERFSFSDESYDKAVTHLKEAVEHMEAASENLSSQLLKEALGPEQAALQAILKAESERRLTQVQMVRNQGGGVGGNRQIREREDLSELFEMEMGRLENRYEMPKRGAGLQQKEQDDALVKLQELARRQERLNRAQKDLARRQDMMTEEQKRRRLEELRREQEELSRQAEELSQRWSNLTRRDRGHLWSNRQRQLDQAAQQMEEAARSLQREEPGLAAAKSRKALANLRDQEKKLSGQQNASISNLLNALNRKAWDLQEREKEILKSMQEMKRKWEDDSPDHEFQASKERQEVLAGKEQLKRDLEETEEMLRVVGARGKQKQPEISHRAIDALRLLKAEEIEVRIKESQKMLQEGQLSLSVDMENRIEQSIDRLSKRLQELDQGVPKSRDEQMQQAATDASDLRRELENLQRQVEALRKGDQGRQRALLQQEQRQGQVIEQSRLGEDRGPGLEQMRESLQRSRRYARGLLRPWARGERWVVDARSIHRELTQKEIEDFLNQPDLWQPLLEPVRELESRLRAQAEISQLKDKLFTTKEQGAPTAYKHLVEEYYRALSEEPERRN